MELPTVHNPMKNEENNVLYDVVAYRKLTYDEIVSTIRAYHRQRKSRRKVRNCTIEIVTLIGSEGL